MKKLISLWVAFCTMLSVVMPGVSLHVQASDQTTEQEVTLRVGTWNIAAKNHPNVKELSKVLSDNGIELAGVQEVDRFNSRNDYDMMADFMTEELPYIHFAKGRDYGGGDFGIGVVSAYPLLETSASPLDTTGTTATKVVERVLIEKQGKQIALYNVHLSYESRELRQVQMAQVAERIALDSVEYKIVVGDFNSDQDYYEYSRMLDLLNMANGKDGKWIDTYHENDDPNMKVFAIDNILVTKNIRIDDVDIVENNLSDHYLMYADLVLLDEKQAEVRNNVVLGAQVSVDHTSSGSPYALVDYAYDQGWMSSEPAQIIVKLDHTVEHAQLKLHWGVQPTKYSIETSMNGKIWTACENNELGTARYVKINLLEKDNEYFDLREIEVYGTVNASLDEQEISSENIVQNGGFEEWSEVVKLADQPANTWWDTNAWENNQKAAPWIYQIYQGTEALSQYYMAYPDSQEKVEGNYSVRVEKLDGATKDGFFKLQNHPFTKNQKYRVSFWYKTKDMADDALILSLFGETKLKATDQWTYFEKEFTATKDKETVNMRVNTTNTGTYWLDDYQIVPVVERDETVKTEVLRVEASATHVKLDENVIVKALFYPEDAEDQMVSWSSSDEKIAVVDEAGNVTIKDLGSVMITATLTSQPLMQASVLISVYSDQIESKKLEEAIKVAEMKNEADYTPESWLRFQNALDDARKVLSDRESQEAIDTALNHLLQIQSLLIVNREVSEDFYKEMRDYWVDEMIGVDETCTDADAKAVSDAQDVIVKQYLETMNDLTDSSVKTVWSDAELLANKNGAEVTVMLDRLKVMAVQTKNPMSVYYQNSEAIQAIMDAVAFTVEKRYNKNTGSTGNWWDGEIGTPKALVDIVLIYYNEFMEKDPQVIADTCEAIDKHIPYANHRGTSSNGLVETGANLIDKVAIVLKRALLDQNHERLEHAKACMAPLFKLVHSGDGFYKDGSFVFHNNIAYNGSYGAVLIDELVNCVAMLSFSDIPVGKTELNFINEQIENAFLPILTYGGNIVDSVRGRAIARYAQQGDTMGAKVMGTLLQYAAIADQKTSAMIISKIKTILDQKYSHEVTQNYALLGYSDLLRLKELKDADITGAEFEDIYHQFSFMNKMIAQRQQYTLALSMSSARIYNTETGNTENTRGYYQGQGMTQIYTSDVNQYNEDYWALVDPYRLPGVTTGHQNLAYGTGGQNNWAGGSTLDGVNGVSGQIINANKAVNGGGTSGVSAKKSWFVLDNRIVAIGSGINNSNSNVDEVETIIDNRKISDEAVLKDLSGNILTASGQSNAKAFLLTDKHASMGYLVLDGSQVNYLFESRTGTWHDINQLGKFTDHTLREGSFLSLALSHGQSPVSESYQYMIVPGADEAKLNEVAQNPKLEVIAVTDNVHAIKDLVSNQEYYNFFSAGSVGDVEVNAPISLTMQRTANGVMLAAADPCRTLSSVEITIKNIDASKVSVLAGEAQIKSKSENQLTLTVTFSAKDGCSHQVQVETAFATESDNYALNKEASASSTVNNANTQNRLPKFAVDGSYETKQYWASEYLTNGVVDASLSDAFFQVDLGEVKEINQVKIFWETGTGKRYDIQVSKTGEEGSFITVYSFETDPTTDKKARTDTLNFDPIDARYVRMQGYARSCEDWTLSPLRAGYTIVEFEVYNTLSLRTSLAKAEQLLAMYPKEVMTHLSDEEYNTIYTNLTDAIAHAYTFMNQGSYYADQDMRALVEELNEAIRAYESKIIHVTSIEMTVSEMHVNKYESFSLKPIIEPENACLKDYTLISSNENVVEIKEDGTLYAVNAGEAVLRAVTQDGKLSASMTITVNVAPEKIQLSDTTLLLKKNQTMTLKAELLPADTTAVSQFTYTSSDPSVVSVDQNGKLNALRKGLAVIIVEDKNLGLSAECQVSVELDYTAISDNLALHKEATASSVVQNANTANRLAKWAVDGDMSTRWASEYLLNGKEDPSFDKGYFTVDLGEVKQINKAVLYWEASKAKDYDLEGSLDGKNFFTIYEYRSEDKSQGERKDELTFDTIEVRYVRMQGIDRSTNYNSSRGGYSLYEFEIYNTKDYFLIMKEAKDLLENYPTDLGAYEELKNKIEEIDNFVQSDAFNNDDLYTLLEEAETCIEAYRAVLVFVEDIELVVEKISLLPGEESAVNVKVLPENATIQDVVLKSSDEAIIKVTENGILAVNPGEAVLKATSKDGGFEREVVITVRTNSKPTIEGHDITINLYHEFDPTNGVKAYDKEDGELEVKLVKTDLNVELPGIYKAVLEAVDSDGNRVEWTRTITVEFDADSYYTSVTKEDVTITGIIEPKAQVNITENSEQIPESLKENADGAYLVEVISTLPLGESYELTLPVKDSEGQVKVYLVDGDAIIELMGNVVDGYVIITTSSFGLFVVCVEKENVITPIEPEQPTEPEQPIVPQQPSQPTTPTHPSVPETPIENEEPVVEPEPTQPQPEQPVQPTKPQEKPDQNIEENDTPLAAPIAYHMIMLGIGVLALICIFILVAMKKRQKEE